MFLCVWVRVPWNTHDAEDNLQESVFSFCHVGPGDHTWVDKPSSKHCICWAILPVYSLDCSSDVCAHAVTHMHMLWHTCTCCNTHAHMLFPCVLSCSSHPLPQEHTSSVICISGLFLCLFSGWVWPLGDGERRWWDEGRQGVSEPFVPPIPPLPWPHNEVENKNPDYKFMKFYSNFM